MNTTGKEGYWPIVQGLRPGLNDGEEPSDFVAAIIANQTACQAQLARSFGNQEAAVKRLSRLLHNERLDPKLLADAVLLQALHQRPTQGKIRLAIDWTID